MSDEIRNLCLDRRVESFGNRSDVTVFTCRILELSG